jgi:MFS family permease
MHSARLQDRPLFVALAGTLSLAIAMGIGRFAFTPLMPMMLHDGLLDITAASWLASVNYFGYLIGALWCTFQPALWHRLSLPPLRPAMMLKIALVATCALTAAMAWHEPRAWPWLRFFAGIASSLAFVFTSAWCLGHLSRLGAPQAGGIVYAGPGVGIAISGLLATAMVQMHWGSSSGWQAFGAMAVLLTLLVWRVFTHDEALPATAAAHAAADNGSGAEKAALTIAYGLAGFGYIITATFLPVIARAALPGSVWLDLFWPILGIGVAVGAVLASRIPARVDQRLLLVGCYLMQAAGVMMGEWLPTLAGFALGSILVGLPFTAITFFAMQVGRRLHPQSASTIIGLLSAAFALGQIVGPPVAAALLARAPNHATGFAWSLQVAALTLVAGAAIYVWMVKTFRRA